MVSFTSIACSRQLLLFLDKNPLIPTPSCANIHFKKNMLGPASRLHAFHTARCRGAETGCAAATFLLSSARLWHLCPSSTHLAVLSRPLHRLGWKRDQIRAQKRLRGDQSTSIYRGMGGKKQNPVSLFFHTS